MRFITIDKSIAAVGEINFLKESFFKIQPGDKISQIGDGRETGSYRTDKFTYPVEYKGSFLSDQYGDESNKYYAFKVPIELSPDDGLNYFLLYESTGLEILRRTTSYIRFFKPVISTNMI